MKQDSSRRLFLKKATLGSLTTFGGLKVVFAENLPKGEKLIADPFTSSVDSLEKHPELILRSDRPLNLETPAHLLNDSITPSDKMFVRNNGISPEKVDLNTWTLTIDGESVVNPKTYTLAELKAKFAHHSYQLILECGGNGRSGFYPLASGSQWAEGAVSCGKWTGVRLKDVLSDVGLKADAVYIGYYGRDVHLSGDTEKVTISRGTPIKKALEDESLIAWSLNDQDIPLEHGHPLRLVIGGWPASVSGKWLNRIAVRNKVHDGAKMEGHNYRIPKYPIQPGEKILDEDFEIIESMPVKSIITYPQSGAVISLDDKLVIKGHAWAGDISVISLFVSIDFGVTWQKGDLKAPVNRLAWQDWQFELVFPEPGYYEVWARAVDSDGKSQPMVVPGWNPQGYLNNSCHRIAIKVKES